MTRLRATVVALVIIAAFLVLPGTAAAVWSNTDCQFCHREDPLYYVDFDTPAVDRDVVCRKCHVPGLVGTHPKHHKGENCQGSCHPKWGTSIPGNVPNFVGSGGAFAAAESQATSSGILHAIHLNPRWPASAYSSESNCRSCHALAACSACHDGIGSPAANHSQHAIESSVPLVPWTGNVSVGTNEAQTENGYITGYQQRCGSDGCHDIDSVALGAPTYMDNYVREARAGGWIDTTGLVTLTGTWALQKGSVYAQNTESASNAIASEASITISGRRFSIVGTKDRYRGIMEIKIDANAPFTVDQYSSVTLNQRTIWMSDDLGPGPHTITIKPTGTKNGASRSDYVSFDHITVYASGVDTLKQLCRDCHPVQGDSDNHYPDLMVQMEFSHDMTQTIVSSNTVDTGYGTYSCNQCHQTSLRSEHRRTTASSYVGFYDGCVICHPTSLASDPTRSIEASYALRRDALPTSWTGTYSMTDGCNFSECHTVKYSRVKHNDIVSKHSTGTAGDSPACSGCHAGDLRAVHYNSIPGNSKVETNGCLVCHTSTELKTDKTCSATNCHLGGYNTTPTHPIQAAESHVASSAGKPFTRAYQGNVNLDDAGLECSVCHSSGLLPAHTDAPAVSCSTGGAGGKGCHLDTAYNSIAVAGSRWVTRKCSECHDQGAKESHDETTTPHFVQTNGCAGSGIGCHDSNDLWALHAIDYYGNPVVGKGCDVAGCHDASHKDVRPTKIFANSCGSTSLGCHQSYAIDHVNNYQHAFTTGSYYNGTSEVGCTNQGGCHNAGGASTGDFGNDFHPNSNCLAGACHGSNPSKPNFGQAKPGYPYDCTECHATGLYTNAAARSVLTTALAAGGHYSETTHTAVGMNTTITAGGLGGATCLDCHPNNVGGAGNGLMNQHTSSIIGGSPYGSAIGCGECHGDTRSYGLAEVIANWSNNTCADCHKVGGSSVLDHASGVPAVAEAGSTCGATGAGCHNDTDLHSLHKNTACNVANCHIYTQQSQRPTIKGCGGAYACHNGYTNTAHGPVVTANEALHTDSSMTTTLGAGVAVASCSTCHTGTLGAAHANSMTGWSDICGQCHNSTLGNSISPTEAKASWTTNDCLDCHTAGTGNPNKIGNWHSRYGTASHEGTTTQSCSGAGCHSTMDLAALHGVTQANGCALTGCHDSQNKAMGSAAKSCGVGGVCHNTYTGTSHGSVVTANEALHTDPSMTATLGAGVAVASCGTCHTGTLGAAHATSMTGWSDICGQCHNSTLGNNVSPNQAKANWTSDDCLDCHTAGTGNPNKIGNWHSGYGTASHEGTTTQACGGGGCHSTMDLAALHGVTRVNGCAVTGCHDSQNKAMGSAAKSCGSGGVCHNTYTSSSHGTISGNETTHTALGLTGTVLDATYNAGGANTCDVCHSDGLENAHASSITSNLAWLSPMCTECHNSTAPVNSVNVIKQTNAWPAKSCEQCHGAPNGAAKHAEYTSGHTGDDGANSCATPACHANTYDLRVLHNNPVTSNGSTAGCDSAGCHDTQNKDMQGAQKSCGENTGGCHTEKTDGNHGSASAHPLTTGSYYDKATESGCINQAGCHPGSSTSDYSSYHYIADQGTCSTTHACHVSESKAGYAGDGDCDTCHDSNYTLAQDRIAVNGAFPNGHYSETTHTAVSMTATLSAGGIASASCNDCHSPTVGTAGNALANQHQAITIPGSPYGATLECGECHGDTRVRGLVEVTANWTTNACIDCHEVGNSFSPLDHASSVPAVQETTSTCGATGINCHTQTELHAVHKNASGGCGLTGCHTIPGQSALAEGTGCGVEGADCHGAYTYDSHMHNGDAAKHQPTVSTQASATQFGVDCGACHDIRTSGASLTNEHAATTSIKTTDASNNCTNCHNNAASTTAISNNWSAKDSTSACTACHTGGLAIHADENIPAHSTESNTGCATSGAGCHNGVDLSRSGVTNVVNTNIHNSCVRCHSFQGAASWSSALIGTGNGVKFATEKKCGQVTGCHTSDLYNPVSGVHRVGRGDVVNGNDAKHIDPSMSSTPGAMPNAAKSACSFCHSAGLNASHATTLTGWSNTCTGCHNSALSNNVAPTQVKTGWTADDCGDCHVAGASSAKVPNWHSKYNLTDHVGVPAGVDASGTPNSCDISCHPTMDSYELGDIHSERPNGCQVSGAPGTCHSIDKPMAYASARTCGVGGVCHTSYFDGNHGFSETAHMSTDENSWKNCGRCHLGYRAEYTRTGAYNGDLMLDMQSPIGLDQLHRQSARGGNGCPTCHDPGSRVYAGIQASTLTANCGDCHVDHRLESNSTTLSTTKSTSSTNLAKTIYLNFTDMNSSNMGFKLATSDNTTTANARLEVGPLGSPYITTTTVTSAMDPLRKKWFMKNIDVSSIEGTQPIRLYLWSGSAVATAMAEDLETCVSRGSMITQHTASTAGFTCGFGDCHDANVVAQHQPYEIPGAFLGTYTWPVTPTRENNATVQSGALASTFYKVKSVVLNMHDIDKIRIRLNLYGVTTKTTTKSFEVRIGSTVIASGSYSNTNGVLWWDYAPGNNDPSGAGLNYIDTSGMNGNTTFDLYLSCSATTNKTVNNTFQIYAATRDYAASTPTDACDLCHLNTIRRDDYGAVESGDTSLSPNTPKLDTFDAQCDTCHPNWNTEHPMYSHRSSAAADTCLSGCHQYTPAIVGTDLGMAKYDLTKQHKWGDNTNAGITYTASQTVLSWDFGTSASWPTTWTRSDATYVTMQNTNARSGYAPQIGVVNGTRNEYSFYANNAIDLSAWRGGTVQFWYKVNVSDASDYLICEYSTTATANYTPLFKVNADQLTFAQSPVLTVPGDGPVWIRFRGAFNATGEYAAIDDIVIKNATRTLPGTMEGGCGIGQNGMCHAMDYPTTGKCSDCHTSVNHHNVVHDLSVGGTRSTAVATGYSFDSCIGTCHQKNLHYSHGVGLQDTEPRPYRGVGDTADQIMTCATCHDSANATIKWIANSTTNTPIAAKTLTCAQCHTGTASMATTFHAGAPNYPRSGNILRGANFGNEFSNSISVSGHLVPPYTNAYSATRSYTTANNRWYFDASGTTDLNFNNHTGAPGAANAAALLRATTADETGSEAAGTVLKNGSKTLSTTTVVHCADCHGQSAAALDGPQGAATYVLMYDGFTTAWKDAPNASTNTPTLICSRCHNMALSTAANAAHNSNGGHENGSFRCISCHVAIPHAWKRPKLLVRAATDPVPYVFNPGTATGSSLNGWDGTLGTASATFGASGNCNASGCKGHGGTNNVP